MAAHIPSPLHREISGLALFVSIRQLIASPVMVGVTHLLHPDNIFFDLKEILDFLAISFPLTLGIAVLFVLTAEGKFNMFALVFSIAGAALLSNLLHLIVEEIPSVDIGRTFSESFSYTENRGGNSAAILWISKIFGVYWKTFGPILFIQSCCIGIYAGYRFLALKKSRIAKKQQPGS